ncbi:serine aminopeptidase domain-containing protein [Prochlorococcus marinus]|uniref:serine aminopeptidase domain-containing protein n=1 Tax=Prochlorococcus marinus TaxID=1219 RepID=UPI0022B3742F|nr:alpha/beta hydrolase [Prochlorococcus marinus]
MVKLEHSGLIPQIGITPFKERLPWIGGDLQTLRDTFVDDRIHLSDEDPIKIQVPSKLNSISTKEYLIAFLNKPPKSQQIKGLVLMIHGLGGSSRRRGLRRMAFSLIESGFAVLRVNLRGASPGREFASGTYSANCNSDIFPVIQKARDILDLLIKKEELVSKYSPLFGVGISLGGTILLNACLEFGLSFNRPALDGLVCISSPLDLAECSASIERIRNKLYQTWLLNRLIRQTLEDPFGIKDSERDLLVRESIRTFPKIASIRAFDSIITAPRWGFKNVDIYYKEASPLKTLLSRNSIKLPNTFFIQALDDPWVPPNGAKTLKEKVNNNQLSYKMEILLTNKGGHNGFHSVNGCWGDDVVKSWLLRCSSSS